jgi:hypothetical protein
MGAGMGSRTAGTASVWEAAGRLIVVPATEARLEATKVEHGSAVALPGSVSQESLPGESPIFPPPFGRAEDRTRPHPVQGKPAEVRTCRDARSTEDQSDAIALFQG